MAGGGFASRPSGRRIPGHSGFSRRTVVTFDTSLGADRLDGVVTLTDLKDSVAFQIGPRLDGPRGPADLQGVDRPRWPEPEPEAGVAGGEVARPARNPADRRPVADPARHPGAGRGRARGHATEPEAKE